MRIPKFFKIYRFIIISFSLCALIYVIGFLPWSAGKYSLFFSARDWQALLVLYMAIRIPLNKHEKKSLLYLIVCMGIYTTIYCIPQYLNPITSIQVTDDLVVTVRKGILVGPFSGTTYFSLAIFSSLYTIVTLSLAVVEKKPIHRLWLLVLTMLIALPAMFSGSRSGLVFLIVSILVFAFYYLRSKQQSDFRKILVLTLMVLLGLGSFWLLGNVRNTTIDRLTSLEESDHSIKSRLSIIKRFSAMRYKYEELMPFIGAGYGVAPIDNWGADRYRIGYGFHQVFLKNYEQGGVVPFLLFFVFLWGCFKSLRRSTQPTDPLSAAFAMAIMGFFFASLANSLVGNAPWFNSSGAFLLFLISLAGQVHRPIINKNQIFSIKN